MDEVFLVREGHTLYLYRVIDEDGVVMDVLVRQRRDTASAEAFFRQAIERTGVTPALHKDRGDYVPWRSPHPNRAPPRPWATTKTVERSHVPTATDCGTVVA